MAVWCRTRVISFRTMLTINADAHTIMSRMHKPDPNASADQQDKRSVVALADGDLDAWLTGTTLQAQALLRPPPVEWIEASHLPHPQLPFLARDTPGCRVSA